jgi:hypothetical protein
VNGVSGTPSGNGNGNGGTRPTSEIAPDESGPRRLVVAMEETTDEPADLRRVRRVCSALDEYPGDLPVEIHIHQRDRRIARLRRGGIDPEALELLAPRLRALLGVLGDVREAGGLEEAARPGIAVGSR